MDLDFVFLVQEYHNFCGRAIALVFLFFLFFLLLTRLLCACYCALKQKTCASVPIHQDVHYTGRKRASGEEVRWRRIKRCDTVCGWVYMSSLVLQSPTSTLTFHSVGGKAEATLITFTTTVQRTLGCHLTHCIHSTCALLVYIAQIQLLPVKGHLAMLHWPTRLCMLLQAVQWGQLCVYVCVYSCCSVASIEIFTVWLMDSECII